jgi:hypothetical protein
VVSPNVLQIFRKQVSVMQQTLYDMIWSEHLVDEEPDGTCLKAASSNLVHVVRSR